MKFQEINQLEHLSSIAKEYDDKKQLIDNDKILSKGYYRNYFIVLNTTKEKPKFSFGLFVIILCLFGIPVFCNFGNFNYAVIIWLFLLIISCVALIVSYIISINRWNRVVEEYNKLIKKYKTRFLEIQDELNQNKAILEDVDFSNIDAILAILKLDNVNSLNEAIELFKKTNKGQDESISDLTKIIINQQKIELERINLENAKIKN